MKTEKFDTQPFKQHEEKNLQQSGSNLQTGTIPESNIHIQLENDQSLQDINETFDICIDGVEIGVQSIIYTINGFTSINTVLENYCSLINEKEPVILLFKGIELDTNRRFYEYNMKGTKYLTIQAKYVDNSFLKKYM